MAHLVQRSDQSAEPTLSSAMATVWLFLCVFVAHFITAQPLMYEQDFPRVFDDVVPFPFGGHFDFPPYDTIFSSRRTPTPGFHMLADLPALMNVPRVKVFCDEARLSVLVDKRSGGGGGVLTGEDVQLGDGCSFSRETPNQLVFTYGLDECGTTRELQDGSEVFTNALHLSFKNAPLTWRTPSTVHISCTQRRSYSSNLNLASLPEGGEVFSIKAMNPSWSHAAESHLYNRGQMINLQVSAETRPEQQLFIQSCFVSASPEPQTRPRHAVILNKGCTTPLGSPHAAVQFVDSNRADVVNVVLNTTYLISELNVHCSVLLSDQGVTSGSKSCNYNVFQSRWEDLGGTAEVCRCCDTKCKGLSVRHSSEGAKAVVSVGPLVIVDGDPELHPEAPAAADCMQSDSSAQDAIVSGSSISRSRLSSPPQGVIFTSQDPGARLTLWLPGQVQEAEPKEHKALYSESDSTGEFQVNQLVSNELPERRVAVGDQEPRLRPAANEVGVQDLNVVTLVDLTIPSQLETGATAEDSPIKIWLGRFGLFGPESPLEANVPQTDEMIGDVLKLHGFNPIRGEPALKHAAAAPREEGSDAGPVIRSKLAFSKGGDGSQTLSYEEEVLTPREEEGESRRCGLDGNKRKRDRRKGLRSTFLDLLRRMDGAE